MKLWVALIGLWLSTPVVAQELYVTDQQGGVAVLAADGFARLGGTPAGSSRGLAVTADGAYLVTANQGSGDLSVFDRAGLKLLARIPIGPSTEMVRVWGHTAYVTYEPPGEKGELAHVAVVDLDRRVVTANFPSGHETEGLEFSADGTFLLVANEGDDKVSIYDLPSGHLAVTLRTGPFGKRPRGIKRLPHQAGYIVTLELGQKFLVLDRNFIVQREVATAAGPYGIALAPNGKHLYIAAAKAGLLQEFDARNYAHLADIPVGKRCWHFSFTPDGHKIVVACGRSGSLYVIDTATDKVTGQVAGFKMPWGIVAYPPASGTLETLAR